MDRRTFLGNGVAVGGLVALSGCTEQSLKDAKSQAEFFDDLFHDEEIDLPTPQKFGIAKEGVLLAEDADIDTIDDLEAYLGEHGLIVEEISEKGDDGDAVLSIEYVVDEVIERGQSHQVGIVAGGYAALVEAGYDGDALEVTLFDPNGRRFGEFKVFTSWAELYNEGDMTAARYGKEAMKELKSV